MATPYRHFPAGRTAAYIMACRLAALLIRKGIPVYTPIGHSHPIAEHGELDPIDFDLWSKIDAPFVQYACALIVVTAEGWESSHGMRHEINTFRDARKPIIYWDPACEVPDILSAYLHAPCGRSDTPQRP
jgi:hypothetical protein